MTRIAALTGSTGFIGSALARRLQAAGWQVRALLRPNSNKVRLNDIPIQQVEGSLEDSDSLRRLVSGADAVIHCAGAVRGAWPAHFDRVNARGVESLVRVAAEQQPLPRFLLISSLAAREPDLSPYAASKREGERLMALAAGRMPWTVLRPPAVYGPGDRELLPLFRWMRRGIAPLPGPASARFSLLYVEDLAEAVAELLNCRYDQCAVFELHDGKDRGYTWSEVIDMATRLRAGRVIRIPVPGLDLLARANLTAARMLGYAPILTPGKVRELRHLDWVCDNTALNSATGWTPRIPLEEGLRRTLDWKVR